MDDTNVLLTVLPASLGSPFQVPFQPPQMRSQSSVDCVLRVL